MLKVEGPDRWALMKRQQRSHEASYENHLSRVMPVVYVCCVIKDNNNCNYPLIIVKRHARAVLVFNLYVYTKGYTAVSDKINRIYIYVYMYIYAN